jgi:hypothetical protein
MLDRLLQLRLDHILTPVTRALLGLRGRGGPVQVIQVGVCLLWTRTGIGMIEIRNVPKVLENATSMEELGRRRPGRTLGVVEEKNKVTRVEEAGNDFEMACRCGEKR